METADFNNLAAQSILRVLSSAGSDAWCFAPIDEDQITHCSRQFLDLWGFGLETPNQSGWSIPLNDSRIGDHLEALGLDRDWLVQVVHSSTNHIDGLPEHSVISGIRRVVLPDDDGRPIGVLLVCERRAGLKLPSELVARAVQSQFRMKSLSPRETEILELVFEGLTNKAAGFRVGISEKTVEKHRSNIMRKLEARSIAQLIRRVAEVRMLLDSEQSMAHGHQ